MPWEKAQPALGKMDLAMSDLKRAIDTPKEAEALAKKLEVRVFAEARAGAGERDWEAAASGVEAALSSPELFAEALQAADPALVKKMLKATAARSDQVETSDTAAIKSVFDKYDVDNSGALDASEVTKLLEEEGMPVTESYIAGLMEVYDADESGAIEFNEFERLYKVVQRKKSKQSSGEDWLNDAEAAVK